MTTEQLPAIRASLEALASRYGLSAAATERLAALHGLLVSEPLAPTAVRDPRKVVDDHLADALVALEIEQVRVAASIADLGSGPGVPGLPLAIALPNADVALVESSARKCAFLELAIGSCGVENAHAVHARAELWTAGLGKMDVVTARALAPLTVVAEYAAPLLKVGGSVVVWRGGRDQVDEAAAACAARELGLEVLEPRQVIPYPGALRRYLHVMTKVGPTPDGFPRRPGVARRRPLGVRPSAVVGRAPVDDEVAPMDEAVAHGGAGRVPAGDSGSSVGDAVGRVGAGRVPSDDAGAPMRAARSDRGGR
jgi:16S rRNA (guanine527-N7)-methyltransferase